VDVRADLSTPAGAAEVFAVVADLSSYPKWLDIVGRAEPTGEVPGDAGPAWLVDLVGRVGPLRRSKRLRMVRSEHVAPNGTAPGRIRFQRHDLDGRSHSDWILDATVTQSGAEGCRLEVHLHYGGSLWVPLLDRLLADEIRSSRERLAALVAS
jgi:hypothetical protein